MNKFVEPNSIFFFFHVERTWSTTPRRSVGLHLDDKDRSKIVVAGLN